MQRSDFEDLFYLTLHLIVIPSQMDTEVYWHIDGWKVAESQGWKVADIIFCGLESCRRKT